MKTSKKLYLLQELIDNNDLNEDRYYEVAEQCDIIKSNYFEYMSTSPINCDIELLRLPTSDFDTCCALFTMLLREEHFCNGSFIRRLEAGQVKPIMHRIILLLSENIKPIKQFSEKALEALNGYYVYALIDPRTNEVFYIGKGSDNRVFAHESESSKVPESEKAKLKRIREIEESGAEVKRVLVNWGMTEDEAFFAESSLINVINYLTKDSLTNIVAGHHVHHALSVEDFEVIYGAENLKPEDIRHGILVIKINKLFKHGMSSKDLYDTVRGVWRASLNTIKRKNIEYVFGVYNQLIVAVYKPDEWHYVYDMVDVPRVEEINGDNYDRYKDRVYFTCKDYEQIDDEGQFYLHKSIAELKVNQSAQNPITYLTPLE